MEDIRDEPLRKPYVANRYMALYRAVGYNLTDMEQVSLDNGQARFGIQIGSDCRKIFYYFTQKDKSLGIGHYFKGNATAVVRLDKDDEWEISISEATKTAKDFVIQKTSFHQSGKIVSKDAKGERFSNEPDILSIPFSKIEDPVQLRVIYPMIIENYPKCIDGQKINIHALQSQQPLMIKIFLAPNEFDFENWMLGIDSASVLYEDTASLAEKKLIVYAVFRKSNHPYFPTTHAQADTIF